MKMHLFLALLVAVTLATAGCGIEPETLQSLRGVVRTTSAPASVEPLVAAPIVEDIAVELPSPDRVDPFTFAIGEAASSQRGNSIAKVEVLGFADVGAPRVLLRTKNSTKSLGVGDSADGVEVIEIHPPSVDLRMGSLQWQASMFDNASGKRD